MSENVTKTKEQDGQKPGEDYRDADGILVCGKCGEPRERMFPAGGIFKEPHLVPTMCRCQREEADRQREETERAEKRRRTERLRKQCFPSSGRYAFCTFDADDGRNAAQSTVCKAFAATFDPKDPEGLVLYGKRGTGKSFHASCTRVGASSALCMELMEASGRRRWSFSSVIWSGMSSGQGRFTA